MVRQKLAGRWEWTVSVTFFCSPAKLLPFRSVLFPHQTTHREMETDYSLSVQEASLKHPSDASSSPVIVSEVPTGVSCPIIGTHDGTFHCDEVLAISMLRLLPTYHNAVVVRTRDKAKLAQCTIVLDVGGEYDAVRLRFDHHQRGFDKTLGEGYKTKLSSAGLVYKHFGKDMLRHLIATSVAPTQMSSACIENMVEKLFTKTYFDFIEHIDGIDNGIDVAESDLRYKIQTHLPGRVAKLNSAWNQDGSADSLNTRFSRALSMVTAEFVDTFMYLCNSWWPARRIVAQAFEERNAVHPSGKVLHLSSYCPWQDYLFELEQEVGLPGHILYVLYGDPKGSSVRIHAVPEKIGSFLLRAPLPEPWRGLRDEMLDDAVGGVQGCTFVHANGFIGGNKTLNGAMKMVNKALSP